MNKHKVMPVLHVSREFSLEMAHALDDYKGACKNIHGHSYKLVVTIKGNPKDMKAKGEEGMVMDFKKLKEMIFDSVIKVYDHALVLKNDSEISRKLKEADVGGKIILVNFQPTCENLLLMFIDKISRELPGEVSLSKVGLQETDETMAEWYAEEN